MSIDPEDRRALYQRVVDELRAQIAGGQLEPGSRVPSANQLTETFAISGMTAQRALRELRHQGLIYGIHGKGTYVHPQALDRLKAAAETAAGQGPDSPRIPRTRSDAYWAELGAIAARGQDATTDDEKIRSKKLVVAFLEANQDAMIDRTPLTPDEQVAFVLRISNADDTDDEPADH
ncbi:MAG: hypothetical protein QOE61_2257 [Micromonosporaceae bacterium]|jgi:DNA-binding transcriptional regulator YhcF (GntR family)|nr:hypothetical protein [Micromonosporaceae bacterium]